MSKRERRRGKASESNLPINKRKAEEAICKQALLEPTSSRQRGPSPAVNSQGQVVESHRPQGEGAGQQAHVREENPDGVLELGQLLKDGRRLDQLPVGLRLLDLQKQHPEDEGGGNALQRLSARATACSLASVFRI